MLLHSHPSSCLKAEKKKKKAEEEDLLQMTRICFEWVLCALAVLLHRPPPPHRLLPCAKPLLVEASSAVAVVDACLDPNEHVSVVVAHRLQATKRTKQEEERA